MVCRAIRADPGSTFGRFSTNRRSHGSFSTRVQETPPPGLGRNIFARKRMLGHSTLDMVNRYLKIVQADVKRAHQTASPQANWGL